MSKMTVEKNEYGIVLLRIDERFHVVKYNLKDDMVSQIYLGDMYNKGVVESRKRLTVRNVKAITKPRQYDTAYLYYKILVKERRDQTIAKNRVKITARIGA